MWSWIKSKYGKKLWLIPILLVGIPLLLCFLFNIRIGPPAGIGLNDSDWLAFWAAYLSFVGTVLVSVVSLAQAGYYNVNFSPELH